MFISESLQKPGSLLLSTRRESTPRARLTEDGELYEGSLAGTCFWRIPLQPQARFRVDSGLDLAFPRGWTSDGWLSFSGPEGQEDAYASNTPGYPRATVGMLVGVLSDFNTGTSMVEMEMRRILGKSEGRSSSVLPLGRHYERRSLLNREGWLYLLMNAPWHSPRLEGGARVRVRVWDF